MRDSVDHIHFLDQRLMVHGDPSLSKAQTMGLWVPSERIAVHYIDIPNAPERKWAELVPWILEDRILQPVDEMHFVIVGRCGNNQLQVLAISQQDMFDWQRVALNAGVAATVMAPDFLALPWEAGRINVCWREGVCLVRHSAEGGFAAKPAVAWAMIDKLIAAAEAPPRLSISIPDSDLIPAHLKIGADINTASIDWQFGDMGLSVNLLTGPFKPQIAGRSLKGWLPAMALMVLSLALLVAYLQITNNHYSHQIEAMGRQAQTSYSRLFTGRKPQPMEVRGSAERQLERLFNQQQSLRSTPVAALIALDSLMVDCECNLIALNADEAGMRLRISSAKKLMSKSLSIPGYQLSIEADKTEGAIVLTLLESPGLGGGK
jgi:type II secretion system protein L